MRIGLVPVLPRPHYRAADASPRFMVQAVVIGRVKQSI
jgi:hypothetical protein